MKAKQLFATAVAFIALTASCKKDDYRKEEAGASNKVSFISSIQGQATTKVTGNSWDSNDAIGVFMKQGADLSAALAANKKYSTSGDGTFSGEGAEAISYPDQGTVDFVAYYPYKADLSGTKLPVQISDQSNQSAIDVLYSNNATGLTKESGTANLTFTHKLTKVELNVTAGTGVDNVDGLTVAYKNVNTAAELDLVTGSIGTVSEAKDVSSKVSAATNAQRVETILLPGDASAKEIVFTLASGTFKWTLPANTNYEAGKKYSYDIQLSTEAGGTTVVVQGVATITDWTNVPSGSVVVPKDGEGSNPGEGEEGTIYEETFGDSGPTKNPRGRMATYTDYDATGVTYSDIYEDEYADIRSTSTINTHVWFSSGRTTGIQIAGIDATGYSNLKLSYDLAANGAGAAKTAIKVKVNGVDHSVTTGTLGGNNEYSTIDISGIASANSITLEFTTAADDNTAGYRLDNIKLVGTK